MESSIAHRFVRALQQLEDQSDATAICALFSPNATLQNPLAPPRSGADGARAFWQEYRKSFGDIRSSFSKVGVGDGFALLEWTSVGSTASGAPVQYEGVSVLDVDGDAISRFRTYFDTQALRARAPGSAA